MKNLVEMRVEYWIFLVQPETFHCCCLAIDPNLFLNKYLIYLFMSDPEAIHFVFHSLPTLDIGNTEGMRIVCLRNIDEGHNPFKVQRYLRDLRDSFA